MRALAPAMALQSRMTGFSRGKAQLNPRTHSAVKPSCECPPPVSNNRTELDEIMQELPSAIKVADQGGFCPLIA